MLMVAYLPVPECLHGGTDTDTTGGVHYGMTSFPQPIGLAAAFDRELVYEIAGIIGDEMRAVGNLYYEAQGIVRYTYQSVAVP